MHVLTEQEKEFLKYPDKFKLHPNRRKIKHKIIHKIQVMMIDFEFFCNYFDGNENGYSTDMVIWKITDHREFLNRKDMKSKFPLKTKKLKILKSKKAEFKFKED